MSKAQKITYASMFLALGLVLPFCTGQIPMIGKMLCPMHLPVLLCGALLGPTYGGFVGFVCPLLRSFIFGMPVIFPTAIVMAIELMSYGVLIGIFFKITKRILPSTILAMLGGRVVYGLTYVVLAILFQIPYSVDAFLAGAFLNAWPGILLQIICVPTLINLLMKHREGM